MSTKELLGQYHPIRCAVPNCAKMVGNQLPNSLLVSLAEGQTLAPRMAQCYLDWMRGSPKKKKIGRRWRDNDFMESSEFEYATYRGYFSAAVNALA